MTITTTYDFGDTIEVNGEQREVKAVHLYVSETGVITERYYLGEQKRNNTIYKEIGKFDLLCSRNQFQSRNGFEGYG